MGAIEPVGITNASASNVRNTNARMNATATDSMVSRSEPEENMPPERRLTGAVSLLVGPAPLGA